MNWLPDVLSGLAANAHGPRRPPGLAVRRQMGRLPCTGNAIAAFLPGRDGRLLLHQRIFLSRIP
jgi:hypothetical protein